MAQRTEANLPHRQQSACSLPKVGLRFLPAGLGLLLSTLAMPAKAAEQVTLNYPPLGNFTIQVDSLAAFAKDGTVNKDLAFFVKLAPPEQVVQLREGLVRRYEMTPTVVTQFAQSDVGKEVFEDLGLILKTGNNQNGSQALIKAFSLAAADPEGVSILNLIRKYPDQTILIDGKLGFQAIADLNKQTKEKELTVAAIQEQNASDSAALPGTPLNVRQPGPRTWLKQPITFRNPNRGSVAIAADLYLPQGGSAPAPLIVISHGLASNRTTFAALATHLASHGFAVALPEHIGSNTQYVERFFSGINSGSLPDDLVHRPADIKFLLDELQTLNTNNPALKGKLNLQQVGVMGQSLGGYTALAAAGAPLNFPLLRQRCGELAQPQALTFNLSLLIECRALAAKARAMPIKDPRVKAVLAINPLTSLFFGEQGMRQIQVPTMIIAGSNDIFSPPQAEQIMPFTWLTTPDRYLIVLGKGTHFSFIGTDSKGILPVPPEMVGPDGTSARAALAATSTAFFNTYVNNQPQYRPYLSATYLRSLVQQPFSLVVTQTLTQAQIDKAIAAAAAKKP
jgi:predicted dienelactone hydrolase